MRQFITPDSIAVTIKMLRETYAGRSFLLVEGDIDARLLKRLVNLNICHVQICYNRANVIRVVAILDKQHFAGHLGLIDRDFSEMLNERVESENIIVTDENDIEMTIYQSDVFDRFINEYANTDKILAVETKKGLSLR